MTIYYRVKTYYHLMLVLLMVDKKNNNILLLDEPLLYNLEDEIKKSKIFEKVIINKCYKNNNIFFRKINVLVNALLFNFLYFFAQKDNLFVTSQHNICGKAYYYFTKSKNIIVLEDGQYTYRKYINNNINSLYDSSFFKKIFHKYFLTIYNPNIIEYILRHPEKLNEAMHNEYKIMKTKINYFNLEDNLKELNTQYKNEILRIFNIKNSLIKKNKKSLILLTQPYEENGLLKQKKLLKLYKKYLDRFRKEEYDFFIKQHPRENDNKYNELIEQYNFIVIYKNLPFELLSIINITFDIGITYDSTAIDIDLIEKKIKINKL